MAGTYADRARSELNSILRLVNRRIAELLLQLAKEEGTDALTSTKASLATEARVRQQIIAIMNREGLNPVVSALEQNAAREAQDAAREAGMGSFSGDAVGNLESIVSGQINDITATFRDGQQEIAAAMRAGVTTGASLADLIRNVASAVDTTFLRAQAAVDTAIMGVSRQATIVAAEQASEVTGEVYVYVYTGPSDGKNREFCARHVDKAYTLDALDLLDNGEDQPKPVSVYLGGYNCRHTLSPMPLQDAIDQGFKVITGRS